MPHPSACVYCEPVVYQDDKARRMRKRTTSDEDLPGALTCYLTSMTVLGITAFPRLKLNESVFQYKHAVLHQSRKYMQMLFR